MVKASIWHSLSPVVRSSISWQTGKLCVSFGHPRIQCHVMYPDQCMNRRNSPFSVGGSVGGCRIQKPGPAAPPYLGIHIK